MKITLRLWAAFLVVCSIVTGAAAHEVRPSIGDLDTSGEVITLDLALNVEAFVAGVDLDATEDTNASPQADAYDVLRALPPEALLARFEPVAAEMAKAMMLTTDDGAALPLVFERADLAAVGDVALLRESQVRFTAARPTNATAFQLSWPVGYGTLILRQVGVEEGVTGFVEGGTTSDAIPLSGGTAITGWGTFWTYIPVGFDHILPKGLDHILFVLGLFFLSLRLGALLWQVTAFTLAHTVTLALGALGLVNLPGSIVEPIIAASIVYVAVENILSPQMSRWRPLVVFAFGLLHGLGFASVLGDFGLPDGQFIPALLGFNIGVELGQLTVIAIAYLLVGYWFGDKPWYRRAIAIPASAVIALIGAWWVIERTLL